MCHPDRALGEHLKLTLRAISLAEGCGLESSTDRALSFSRAIENDQ